MPPEKETHSAKKTHADYVDEIGGTAATATGYLQRRWNRYYFRSCRAVVAAMLQGEIGTESTVLDVGTSHGNWHGFLRRQGFSSVLGVELDPGRADLIIPGAILTISIMEALGFEELMVSDRGILEGIVLELAGEARG